MKHEAKLATVENIVTALCFGAGALLVVLALHTLSAVKPVNAVGLSGSGHESALSAFDSRDVVGAGTYSGTLSDAEIKFGIPGKAQ